MERRAAVLEIIGSHEPDYPPMSVFLQGDPILAGQNLRYLLRPLKGVPQKSFGVKDNLPPGYAADMSGAVFQRTGRLG
jgi:hypothetical protein